jgi:hypothetical protein
LAPFAPDLGTRIAYKDYQTAKQEVGASRASKNYHKQNESKEVNSIETVTDTHL